MLRLIRKMLCRYGQPLLAAVLLFSWGQLHADCSSSIGAVTINEYNDLGSNNPLGSTYVEIKILSTPPPADLANWKINSYTKTGALNGSVNIPSSGTGYCASSAYRAAAVALSSGGKGYVHLVDAAGKLVDALYVNVTPPTSVLSCPLASNLQYDYDIASSPSQKNLSRNPDGTGNWVASAGSGNNSKQTLCQNNQDQPSPTQTFNAWTNAASKTISTQVAGSGFNLTVGAFDSNNAATSYSGTVAAQLEYCTNVSRTVDGDISCGGSWAAITGATANATFSNASTATASLPAVGDVYEIVRVKLTAGGTTGDATDYFAIRPASLTVAASDASPSTAGTGRPLDNSGNVHQAGRPFTITLTTGNDNYPGTLLSVADLTPTATLTAPTNGIAGTLDEGSWTAISGGGLQTATASYSEAGPFGVTYEDRHFADIDADDSTTAQRYFSGTTTFGRFIPEHFDTSVTKAGTVPMDCPTGLTCPASYNGLVYAGQGFTVTITARNAGGATTTNYKAATSLSKATTLTAFSTLGGASAPSGSGAGTLAGNAAAAGDFSSGVATLAAVSYAFTTPPGTPTDLYLRATENAGGDGVTSLRNPTTASVEGGIKVAQGRIRISNAFGNGRSPLDVPVAAQIWNGQVWAANNKDGSTLASSAVVSSPALTLSSLTFSGGKGALRFAAPGTAGSYDIALNLGAGGASLQSCVSGLAGGTAAGLAWLRSRNGNCATTYDRDPSARATFGIYPPESQRTIHVRELF